MLFSFVGMPGLPEIVILVVVAFIVLVIFGNRLPNVMRNLGKGIVEFKKGARGMTEELERAGEETDEEKVSSQGDSSQGD